MQSFDRYCLCVRHSSSINVYCGCVVSFCESIWANGLNVTPNCFSVVPTPTEIWPQNYDYDLIFIDGVTDPNSDAADISVQFVLEDQASKYEIVCAKRFANLYRLVVAEQMNTGSKKLRYRANT